MLIDFKFEIRQGLGKKCRVCMAEKQVLGICS